VGFGPILKNRPNHADEDGDRKRVRGVARARPSATTSPSPPPVTSRSSARQSLTLTSFRPLASRRCRTDQRQGRSGSTGSARESPMEYGDRCHGAARREVQLEVLPDGGLGDDAKLAVARVGDLVRTNPALVREAHGLAIFSSAGDVCWRRCISRSQSRWRCSTPCRGWSRSPIWSRGRTGHCRSPCCQVGHRHVLSISTRPRPKASIRPHRPGMSRSSR